MNDTVINIDKVTRVEVIDQDGRSYTNWNIRNQVQLSQQDDNRTLKVFIDRNRDITGENPEKTIKYYKNNAEEDYIKTPISVLRYISELEKRTK